MHPKIFQYAEKLASKLPNDLNVVYFTNSGSEANDLAILLARLYTKNYDIITLKNAYHGASTSCMGLTGWFLFNDIYSRPLLGKMESRKNTIFHNFFLPPSPLKHTQRGGILCPAQAMELFMR